MLIAAVVSLCLVVPGVAFAADNAALQVGSVAQPAQETGLSTQAAAKSVTLYAKSATKGTTTLKAKGLKAAKAKWTSSKKAVATVKAGKVTAKKAGKTTIKAVMGKKTFTFKVTVKNVALNKKSITLKEGQVLKGKIKLVGDNVKKVTSSDSKVVKAGLQGGVKLTGVSAGKATVTVVSKAGKKFKCTVTVTGGSNVSPDKAITGIETNNVVLDGKAAEYTDGYYIHLKVADGSIAFDKWSKSFKLKLVDGATCSDLVQDETYDFEYDGHKVTHGKVTVHSGNMSLTYTVEAFEASSGMYELT